MALLRKMLKALTSLSKIICLLGICIAGSSQPCFSTELMAESTDPWASEQLRQEHIDEWYELLSLMGRQSLAEGAGSHGSMGTIVGAGYSQSSITSSNPLIKSQLAQKTV